MRTKLTIAGLLLGGVLSVRAAPLGLTISIPQEAGTDISIPMSLQMDLSGLDPSSVQEQRFQLRAFDPEGVGSPIPAQFEAEKPGSFRGTVSWLIPPGGVRATNWVLEAGAARQKNPLSARRDPATGHWDITEGGQSVLRYNYQTNVPGEVLTQISPDNRKYARARGDYIHPLYGLNGEELTKDWSPDHPHHRGIYWAWPEVDYRGERGDLHALQRVFARPTGHCAGEAGPVYAQIQAENLWLWEDREAIVREQATIRVWHAAADGRFIDLEFQFAALNDEVAIARRETGLYGGLNVRLAPVKEQTIATFSDPPEIASRRAWAELSGFVGDCKAPLGVAILQNPTNPDYPGDWIQYPEINWLQPTFPASGTRYVLRPDRPLLLRYRLWLHSGKGDEATLARAWMAYAHPPAAALRP